MSDLTLLSNYLRSDDFASGDLSQLNFGPAFRAGALALLGLACSTVPAQTSPSEKQRIKDEELVRGYYREEIVRAKIAGKKEILLPPAQDEPTSINFIEQVLGTYSLLRVKIIDREVVIYTPVPEIPTVDIRTWYKVQVLETLSQQSRTVDEVELKTVPSRFLPLLPSEGLLCVQGGAISVDNIRVIRLLGQNEHSYVAGDEYLIAAYMYPGSRFIIPIAGAAGIFRVKDTTLWPMAPEREMAQQVKERYGNDLNLLRFDIRQITSRTITWGNWPDAPYEVSKFTLGDAKSIKSGEPFEADGEWLKKFSFTIKNKSDKAITFMRVDVHFPETKATGPLSTYQFDIGHSLIDPVKRGQPIILAPDATTFFELNDKRFDILKTVGQRRGYQLNDITKADFSILQVEFTDKTMWWASQWFKFDEATKKMQRVSP